MPPALEGPGGGGNADLPAEQHWLLSAEERGNDASEIDRRHGDSRGWTQGNAVLPLVHGATYFARLHEELSQAGPGDQVWFLDWRGDVSQRLAGKGTELGSVMTQALDSGADVRALVWRSHPDLSGYSQREALHIGEVLNVAGGEVLLDERVARFGSHHQKIVLIHRAGRPGHDVAFTGGIDLCHGRGDDELHEGDPQPISMDDRYGPRPAWHDVQLEVRGPAVGDLSEIFRERWTDTTPLGRRVRDRRWFKRIARQLRPAGKLPPRAPAPPAAGAMTVQVLRTYPAKRVPFPFAPRGERSIALAYAKALARARALIYVEDQYLWSPEVGRVFAEALIRSPELRMIAVVPRHPDRDGRVTGPLNRIGQLEAMSIVRAAGGDRVAVYDLENEAGWPIYVHAKLCMIDDVWLAVGSDNLNLRSWTHDSEVCCSVIDRARDKRAPLDPGGHGDGARMLPRELRLRLWREHLGPGVPEEEMLDLRAGFAAWRRSAAALDAWHEKGQQGPRPAGRARQHRPPAIGTFTSRWARPLYRLAVDPDGRPPDLRRTGIF